MRHSDAGHALGPLGWLSQHCCRYRNVGIAGYGSCGGAGGGVDGAGGAGDGGGGDGRGEPGGGCGLGLSGGDAGGGGLGRDGGAAGGGASESKKRQPSPAQLLHTAQAAASGRPWFSAWRQIPIVVAVPSTGLQQRVVYPLCAHTSAVVGSPVGVEKYSTSISRHVEAGAASGPFGCESQQPIS